MRLLPKGLLLAITLVGLVLGYGIPAAGSAANIYIAQSAVGAAHGADCNDAYAYTFFNTASDWGSGASQIGPGTTVYLCGTFTGTAGQTLLTFQAGGTSGSPITLAFTSGANLTAPYWSANGAISSSGHSYIVINGGTNGTIQNTANGTSLTYHQPSYGVGMTNCTHCEVENLTVRDIYINQGSSSSATDTAGGATGGVYFQGSSTGSIFANNTFSDMSVGLTVSADPNADASNLQIYGNSISDMHWGIAVVGGDSGDTMNNLLIYGNTITNWTNWYYPASAYHQDGIILYNVGNSGAGITATIYNNYIYGDFADGGSPTGEIYCADFSTCTIFNNLLVDTGTIATATPRMWLGQSTNWGKNMTVYNNTMVGASGTVCIQLFITGTLTSENNVCNNPHTLYAAPYSTEALLEAAVATSNYNVWFGGTTIGGTTTGTPTVCYNESGEGQFLTYSAWQALGYDANSSTSTPNLNSSYVPQPTSSAIGLGTNLYSVCNGQPNPGLGALCYDKAGNARPTSGAWDIGAYNYTDPAPAPPTGVTDATH
jgi:hypothetical protein